MVFDLYTIIFRFVLFGLLAYKVKQMICSYGIPYLQQEVESERKQHMELLEKEKLLTSTQHRLENQMSQQSRTLVGLEKKIQQWHNVLVADHQERIAHAVRVQELVNVKRKQQSLCLQRAKDAQVVIPEVFANVEHELALRYNGDAGKKKLQSCIQALASDSML
ncbi:MAG: hypothetical protein US69_C0022G0008 [candidate division TM6 bacterium GW2011_GWF2_38_10]|nr:MAG: hypothetical protein US69_C0022G0008 [candidate division TM6 bacterium GW2011_GWF2_38_10]